MRTGNSSTGYTSSDGINWGAVGSVSVPLDAGLSFGLLVSGGSQKVLSTATFDNVSVTGIPASLPPALATWKLDETTGPVATDSRGNFDGTYNNVVLAQPGATIQSGTSVNLNGANANLVIPPLNLKTNTLTITAWIRRSGAQNPFSAIFFNRANSTIAGLHFGTANELRYTWNDSAGTYNFNSGIFTPDGQWAFVALVIEPSRARLYQFANGSLSAATNNVSNPVQAFDGVSYLGQDPTSSSRYMNGGLDEVSLYPGLALSPAQIIQLANPPLIAFTSPQNGSGFPLPGTVPLTAAISGIANHTVQQVQFFNQGILVGGSSNAPYSVTLSNLSAGTYSATARLFFDNGWAVDSSLVNYSVLNPPATPQSVTVTALSGNVLNVSWLPANFASGYLVNRNGSPLATVSTTGFADFDLTPGTSYCYTIVATNLVASSVASTSVCATTLNTGSALAWNAATSASGPSDGDGNWDAATADWWNGIAATTWVDGRLACFGVNPAANCAVNLASAVAPSGLVVNAVGGGSYTLGGTGPLTFSGTPLITVNGNAVITSPISATALTKAGNGSLVLSNANPALNATVLVNAGLLEMQNGPAATQIGYVVGANATLRHGYNTSPNYTKGIVIYGDSVGSGHGLSVAAGTVLSEQTITLSNAPTTIGGYGSGANGQLQGFDINGDNLVVRSAASGSVIASNVSINVAGGYGMRINTENGSKTAAGDLVINGPIIGGNNSLFKYGAGSLRLAATNLYSAATVLNAGTLQLASPQTPLGSGLLSVPASGTVQASVSTTLPNNISVASGQTLTLDTLANSLTLAGSISNSGSLFKSGTGTLVLAGANSYSGTTIVNAGTLQVDGTTGSGAVTVRNTTTLSGSGVVRGSTSILAGGRLAPGTGPLGFGRLIVSNQLTLAGQTLMKAGRTAAGLSNDVLSASGTLQYGGSLLVTNVGSRALAGGDSFKLFTVPGAGTYFTSVTLPALPVGLVWNTNALKTNGTISILITTTPSFGAVGIQGSDLVIKGSGGVGNAGFVLLGSTNAALPVAQWTRLSTNAFQVDGSFSVTNTVAANAGPTFYSLQILTP